MDRVTKSYLDQFRVEQSLDAKMPESDVFEYFADYCVVSNLHEEEFDVANVMSALRMTSVSTALQSSSTAY